MLAVRYFSIPVDDPELYLNSDSSKVDNTEIRVKSPPYQLFRFVRTTTEQRIQRPDYSPLGPTNRAR
jgi:hypothetical protein